MRMRRRFFYRPFPTQGHERFRQKEERSGEYRLGEIIHQGRSPSLDEMAEQLEQHAGQEGGGECQQGFPEG